MKKIICFALAFVLLVSLASVYSGTAFAQEKNMELQATIYLFENSKHYVFSDGTTSNNESAIGKLYVNGDIIDYQTSHGIKTFHVNSDNPTITYSFNTSVLERGEQSWHLVDDKTKKIDDIELDSDILKGAIVVQSSRDGKIWFTEKEYTNCFASKDEANKNLYALRDIQIQNGCYFRIIVAYKMEKVPKDKGWFDSNEEKKIAEVYTFYAISSDLTQYASSTDTPKKNLGKLTKVDKDNGYNIELTKNTVIDKDDPHSGHEIGQFYLNGYTRETIYNGNTVFLKNVGDKPTLWFNLNTDINALWGNASLSIADDDNGYDTHSSQVFTVQQARDGFKHGALIIRYTDYEGVEHDPIVYTDFLAAYATTTADTRVQLFEEGDYEVCLDYEIKNSHIKIAPTYTDYKILFKFSIRNSNSMVYPFDSVTGKELADNELTPNGFRLDMAKSRYLDIDIKYTTLLPNNDGTVTADTRYSKASKDGNEYDDEGIYYFTVTNRYTNVSETKTIYVGNDKYYATLAKYGFTISELNEKLLTGVTIADDGTIISPEATEAPTETEKPIETAQPTQQPITSSDTETAKSNSNPYTIYGIGAAAFAILIFVLLKKKKKEK